MASSYRLPIFAWVGLGLVALSTILGWWALADSPWIGAVLRDDAGVVRVVDLAVDGPARGLGLSLGDTILELGGHPVDPLAFQRDPDRIASWSNLHAPFEDASVPLSGRLRIEWIHEGSRMGGCIEVRPLGGFRAARRALPFALVCWGTMLFSMLVLRRRDEESTRVMTLLAIAVAMCYLSFLPTQARDFALSGELSWFLLAWGYFAGQSTLILSAHLGMVLPKPIPVLERLPWLRALPWIALVLVVVEHRCRLVDRPFLVSELASMAGIATCVALLGRTWSRSVDPVVKAQMRWVFLGFFAGCVPPLLLAYLPFVLGRESLLPDSLLIWFVIPLPLGILLSVLRYRLLDIGSLVDWTIAHTLTILLLGATETVAWWLALGRLGDGLARPFAVACLTSGIFVYAPLRERILGILARRSGRRLADSSEAVRHLLESVVAHGTVDRALESTLRAHPGAFEVRIEPGLVVDFHAHPQGALGTELGFEDERAGDLWIPFRRAEAWWTCRLVSAPGRSWRREDLRQAWAVLAASSPLSDLEALRGERSALLRELHDGLGNHLHAALAVARGNDPVASEAVVENLQAALDTLGAGFSVLATTPSLIAPALVRLADRMRPAFRASGAVLEESLSEELADLVVPPETLVVLVRATQELLGNALRHSGAGRVRMAAGIRRGGLLLEVEDDGRGFDPHVTAGGGGVDGIRQRVHGVGGVVSFLPRDPRGLRVEIAVPLPGRDRSAPSGDPSRILDAAQR